MERSWAAEVTEAGRAPLAAAEAGRFSAAEAGRFSGEEAERFSAVPAAEAGRLAEIAAPVLTPAAGLVYGP